MEMEYKLTERKPNRPSYYRGGGIVSRMQLAHLIDYSSLLFPHINHCYHRELSQLGYNAQGLNHLPKNKTKSCAF